MPQTLKEKNQMAENRIYLVTEANAGQSVERLVRAGSQSQALNAVIHPRFSVTKASTDDVVRLMGSGEKVHESDNG